jgi:SPX domain protein involved in polyphosphate accumulation
MFPSLRIRHSDRFELKYLLDWSQYQIMVAELSKYLTLDRQGDQEGRYDLTSLYYDSPDHKCYWNKIEGHRFRRKVRVRVYGQQKVTPNTLCFAEIKQRTNKTLQKKRVLLPYTEAVALCGSGEEVAGRSTADQVVIDELLYLHHMLQLQPACVINYTRLAFESSEYDPGLRVTFDTQLKCRLHDLDLLSTGYTANQYFLPPQYCIMEIKVNHRIPYWLIELIGQHNCTLRRMSKYCTALEQSKSRLTRQQIIY